MFEEATCRRPGFRAGREIKLADGQLWTFPAPDLLPEPGTNHQDDEYMGLLRVVCEAEDRPDRCLAELALAIHLIKLNYELSSSQLQSLFTFREASRELVDSQFAFDALAREHLEHVCPQAALPESLAPRRPRRPGALTRLGHRLRNFWPPRRWSVPGREREALS